MISNRPEVSRYEFWPKRVDVYLIYQEKPIYLDKPNSTIKKEVESFENKGMKVELRSLFPPFIKDVLLAGIGKMKRPHSVPQ